MTDDQVHHPRHYTAHASSVECIEITEWLGFNLGNALKYLWRSGLKDSTPASTDLKKAAWYLRREVKRRLSYDSDWIFVGGGDVATLAGRVLAIEGPETPLGSLLTLIALGHEFSVESLTLLADRLDPEGTSP